MRRTTDVVQPQQQEPPSYLAHRWQVFESQHFPMQESLRTDTDAATTITQPLCKMMSAIWTDAMDNLRSRLHVNPIQHDFTKLTYGLAHVTVMHNRNVHVPISDVYHSKAYRSIVAYIVFAIDTRLVIAPYVGPLYRVLKQLECAQHSQHCRLAKCIAEQIVDLEHDIDRAAHFRKEIDSNMHSNVEIDADVGVVADLSIRFTRLQRDLRIALKIKRCALAFIEIAMGTDFVHMACTQETKDGRNARTRENLRNVVQTSNIEKFYADACEQLYQMWL